MDTEWGEEIPGGDMFVYERYLLFFQNKGSAEEGEHAHRWRHNMLYVLYAHLVTPIPPFHVSSAQREKLKAEFRQIEISVE